MGKQPATAAKPARKGAQIASKNAQSGAKKSLAPKVLRFIDEYMVDMNGSAAYQRAGYKASSASAKTNARRLLTNADVRAEIARRAEKTSEKVGITSERLIQEAWNIVTADPGELIQYRRLCCPECWPGREGAKHDPNAACQQCEGEGRGDVLIADTRKLSPAARSLYAGVKITKDGLEVKMHSKLDALEKLFKHRGLYEVDNRQKVDALADLLGRVQGSAIKPKA